MGVAPQPNIFATVGTMARPAGVAGMMASDPKTSPHAVYYGQQIQTKGMLHTKHALRVASPYAEMTPPNWFAREPSVRPNQKHTGAGCVSAGSIDNTYLPAPLRNMWGKARELSAKEVSVPPHKQCTDLLIVSKGGKIPPPAQTVSNMKTVRPSYTKCIPFLHQIDPQRFDSGFTREPNIIPGAKPAPAFYMDRGKMVAPGPDWKLQKLKYDQANGNARINVSRVVRTGEKQRRPGSAPPRFMATPAGLPGGLSLVAVDAD